MAADDGIRIADVCSNPDNYASSETGIRIVSYETTTLAIDKPMRQVWESRFIVEWAATFNGSPTS